MRAAAPALFLILLLAGSTTASLLPTAPVALPVTSTAGGATVYPTWPVLTAELQSIAAERRDIVRLHSAGTSARGLDLWLVEIADFENPERVPLEDREVLWVDGGTHANEYSGVMFVMHLLRWLAYGYEENETATWIVENRHTWIMPLLNPEGSMNGVGRLNDNGVNINRNYPVGWGDVDAFDPTDPAGSIVNNPGPYAASEPETQAVIAAWLRTQPDYVASIHCCGNLWLYPYGIEGRDPHLDDAPVFSRICDEAYAEVREACGPVWSTIYPASGSSADAAYEIVGAAAFGFEMSGREAAALWGQPFTAAPVEETEYESWNGLLHAFLNVERYGARPNLTLASIASDRVVLRVTNDGWGNLTGGSVRLTDASGAVRTAALPRLAPGAAAEVAVPGGFAAGSFDLSAAWPKRALAQEGALAATLRVADAGGALVGSLDPAAALEGAAAEPAAIPFPALGLLAVCAVAAGLVRRAR